MWSVLEAIISVLILCAVLVQSQIQVLENELVFKNEVILKLPEYSWKQSTNYNITGLRNRMLFANDITEIVPNKAGCKDVNYRKQQKLLRKMTKCEPRPLPVELIAPPGTKVIPNVIIVKRCSGNCSGKTHCSAVETTNTTIFLRTVTDGQVSCSSTIVSEDTKCRCRCQAQPGQCVGAQVFNVNTCKCGCPETKVCSPHHQWNERACSCVCNRTCTTGTFLDKDLCKCVIFRNKLRRRLSIPQT